MVGKFFVFFVKVVIVVKVVVKFVMDNFVFFGVMDVWGIMWLGGDL